MGEVNAVVVLAAGAPVFVLRLLLLVAATAPGFRPGLRLLVAPPPPTLWLLPLLMPIAVGANVYSGRLALPTVSPYDAGDW